MILLLRDVITHSAWASPSTHLVWVADPDSGLRRMYLADLTRGSINEIQRQIGKRLVNEHWVTPIETPDVSEWLDASCWERAVPWPGDL